MSEIAKTTVIVCITIIFNHNIMTAAKSSYSSFWLSKKCAIWVFNFKLLLFCYWEQKSIRVSIIIIFWWIEFDIYKSSEYLIALTLNYCQQGTVIIAFIMISNSIESIPWGYIYSFKPYLFAFKPRLNQSKICISINQIRSINLAFIKEDEKQDQNANKEQ